MTWGHPVTSGLPTIDYFISCEHGETKDSETHYTERLVRLPRLNVCLARPQRGGPPRTRSHFGLPEDAHVYACPQMLFKFHPDFDAALAGVLAAMSGPSSSRWSRNIRSGSSFCAMLVAVDARRDRADSLSAENAAQ